MTFSSRFHSGLVVCVYVNLNVLVCLSFLSGLASDQQSTDNRRRFQPSEVKKNNRVNC